MKLNKAAPDYVMFWCPGCGEPHAINSRWIIDFEKVTIQPSILVTGGSDPKYRCHSFVTDGQIRFLDDCSHDKKGQTLLVPDWPYKKDEG